MSGSIDIFELYGSRQDTDAAVIRHLDRNLAEAERQVDQLRYQVSRINLKLEELGLSYRAHVSRDIPEGIIFGEPWEGGPGLTRELVDTIRPEKREES